MSCSTSHGSTTSTAAPELAAPAAERAEAALRAAIAGGGLSALEVALEVALAAAPREVREGGVVGAEARARCDRLLKAQQEAEREAKQEAAAAAARAAAAEAARRAAARAVAARTAAERAAAPSSPSPSSPSLPSSHS